MTWPVTFVIGAAAASKIVEMTLRDSSTGQMKTGVAYGSVTYSYIREGDNANKGTGTCVTATKDVYSDHGWVETDIAGVYQFGVPQAALASGKNAVSIKLSATGALDVFKRILIITTDLRGTALSILTQQTARDAMRLSTAATFIKGGIPDTDASTGLILTGYGAGEVTVGIDHILTQAITCAAPVTINPQVGSAYELTVDSGGRGAANMVYLDGASVHSSTAGRLAAALIKILDVATPVFTAESVNQGADNNVLLADATNGLAAIKTAVGSAITAISGVLSAVSAITTNVARAQIIVPWLAARPATGSTTYLIKLNLYNLEGVLENADAPPTFHAADASGASLDALLTGTTLPLIGGKTGQYQQSFAVASTAAVGGVYFSITWAIGGVAMAASAQTVIEDAESLAALASIQGALAAMAGADGKAVISTDVQDLSGTLSVNAKKLNGAAPNNAAAAPSSSDNATAAAAAILVTPAQKIVTDGSGCVMPTVLPDNTNIGVAATQATNAASTAAAVKVVTDRIPLEQVV